MGQITMSDYLFSSLLYSKFLLNRFAMIINDEDIPEDIPLKLDTTSLRLYFPQLYERFPNKKLKLEIHQLRFIDFKTSEEGSKINYMGLVAYHLQPENTRLFLTRLEIEINLNFNIRDYNNGRLFNLTGMINQFLLKTSIVESNIGEVNMVPIERFLNIMIGRGIVPSYNRDLLVGIPLSIHLPEGLSIHRCSLGHHNRFNSFSADYYYNIPPTKTFNFFQNFFNSFFEKLFKKNQKIVE
jgi:hypothetical protein